MTGAEEALCNDPDGCISDPRTGPPRPATPVLTRRTDSSLTVEFKLQAGWTSWALQRRAPGGAWATAAAGNNPVGATRSFADGGRPADSRWCYRLKATNSVDTAYSAERCGLTALLSSVNPALATISLRVKVANQPDAGTDGSIGVRLSSLQLPGVNFTGLNRAIDDFERNSYEQYILFPYTLTSVRDITELTLTNYSTDGVCIESVELFANGAPLFSRNFGSATCRWIETDAPHSPTLTIPFEELRADPGFMYFTRPPLFGPQSAASIATLMEAVMGAVIWARPDVDWGQFTGPAVELRRISDDTIHLDFDLEGIANNAPNPEIDVDFDLRFRFVPSGPNWLLTIDVLNFAASVDLPWWTEVLGSLCVFHGYVQGVSSNCATQIEDYLEGEIAKSLGGQLPTPQILVTAEQLQQFGCSATSVPVAFTEPDGAISFTCR